MAYRHRTGQQSGVIRQQPYWPCRFHAFCQPLCIRAVRFIRFLSAINLGRERPAHPRTISSRFGAPNRSPIAELPPDRFAAALR